MAGYVALCYHYIRDTQKKEGSFHRLLGTSQQEFSKHLDMLQGNYQLLRPQEVMRFSKGTFSLSSQKIGILLTFDDGLADHYQAAQILAQRGLSAYFFLPTCILKEKLPANPTILHYGIAAAGLTSFLEHYRNALEEYRLPIQQYDVVFEVGKQDPWEIIAQLKQTFRYRFSVSQTRAVLLEIYRTLLVKRYPSVFESMHLSEAQVREMIAMGHAIGVHSHTHVSVAVLNEDESLFHAEVIEPKKFLEATFQVHVDALSYPFGGKQDCLTWEALIARTRDYDLAFTVEEILNTQTTSAYELGRYMPMSTDTDETLHKTIERIVQRGQGGRETSVSRHSLASEDCAGSVAGDGGQGKTHAPRPTSHAPADIRHPEVIHETADPHQ
ncbi:MAG: polysaccharide deacetylase family protein [Candidatus Omnitrophica bacterium]|nr:polysaccharide deacetylase family protein [Candidatus Omnitrophota bacterium]